MLRHASHVASHVTSHDFKVPDSKHKTVTFFGTHERGVTITLSYAELSITIPVTFYWLSALLFSVSSLAQEASSHNTFCTVAAYQTREICS